MIAIERSPSARVLDTSGERLSVQLMYTAPRSEKSEGAVAHICSCSGLSSIVMWWSPLWSAPRAAPHSSASRVDLTGAPALSRGSGAPIQKSVRLRHQDGRLTARPPAPSLQQADPLGALDRLGAVADPELPIQRARVLLDRVAREVQLAGDLGVGGARSHQLEHGTLALGEPERAGTVVGLEHRPAQTDHPHGAGDAASRPVFERESGRAGGTGSVRRDLAGAGEQQHARGGLGRPQLLTHLGS